MDHIFCCDEQKSIKFETYGFCEPYPLKQFTHTKTADKKFKRAIHHRLDNQLIKKTDHWAVFMNQYLTKNMTKVIN